ncbi:type VI secretion system baseplate subunit TssE [Massilia sp. W12]|uniref:type VI secretion system baseplate subunit TssE n=1 Tax=Massilia sp. W12 TaxID=3126507 RepID=UPI0030D29973
MQFLLERLAAAPAANRESASAALKTAVAAQIQRLVAARVVEYGNDMNLLEAGVPNVVEISAGDKHDLERYALRLTRLIKRYEPRLLEPKIVVQASGDPQQPFRLMIKGHLDDSVEIETFYFELPRH